MGSGFGQNCLFNDATWQVAWDEDLAAFVTRKEDSITGNAVQPLPLSSGASIFSLSELLIEAGSLDANAPCIWQTVAPRPAPRTMAFYVFMPIDPVALSPTLSGDIPEPACGPYGASTHSVRYFLTDLHWPYRAIFVEEEQERPMFDPASITALP